MIRWYKSPSIARLLFPSLVWEKKSKDRIYLTFDDGPDPEVTLWVLEELRKVEAKATFFCLGKNVREYPSVIKQLVIEGHLVANHTFSHLKGWESVASDYLTDIKRCDDELENLGVTNNFFRPPYGSITTNQMKKLRDRDIIMWDRLSWDFDPRVNLGKSSRALKRSKPGSILVFHDSQKAFNNLRVMLPELLTHFKNQGLQFSTLND